MCERQYCLILSYSIGTFKCADENEMCKCSGTVKYGLDPKWSAPKNVGSRIECTNKEFGDVSQNTVKTCMCTPSGMRNICCLQAMKQNDRDIYSIYSIQTSLIY